MILCIKRYKRTIGYHTFITEVGRSYGAGPIKQNKREVVIPDQKNVQYPITCPANYFAQEYIP